MQVAEQKPECITYQLWHRPQVKGARWRKVGEPTTHADAVHRMQGKGEFWIAELRNPKLAQMSLFA